MTTISEEMARFRKVLGHFPTGVAVIAGLDADGKPAGMAIGSFSSVSLDPPLVAFMPDKSSTSWPKFQDSGHFCVNILGSDQESVCRTFAVSGGDKFAQLSWRPAGSGSPILDGVLAWIDCDLDVIHEAGDHYIVIGKVRELDVGSTALPLVFFQGGYGRFSALSLAAWESDLVLQMRSADLARPHMERVAEELEVECVASAVVGADMVLIARANGGRSSSLSTAVGQRIPFEPPMGAAFVAWAPPSAQEAWFERMHSEDPADTRRRLEQTLTDVRQAGYSVAKGHRWHSDVQQALARNHGDQHRDETAEDMHRLIQALEPEYESPMVAADDVRTVSTPVFGPGGVVVMMLSVTVARRLVGDDLRRTAATLRGAADAVTHALGGAAPEHEPVA